MTRRLTNPAVPYIELFLTFVPGEVAGRLGFLLLLSRCKTWTGGCNPERAREDLAAAATA